MRIIVAEDEPKVQRFIREALQEAGMVVDAVPTADDLLSSLQTGCYDILILDRLLRGRDSLESLSRIRALAPTMQILILSALSEVEDRVAGLSGGADDYLAKPFHVSELIARVHALGRRKGEGTKGSKPSQLIFGDLKIDLETQRVYRGNIKIDLTGKEFRALVLMVRNPGKVFSKTALLDQVWDMNHYPESNVVEVTVAKLRSKVDKGHEPIIQSRRGVGYWIGKE